jgi:hypothetical protein
MAAILEAILALLKAIPYFDKWFSKSPAEKVADAKDKSREEIDEFKKTGRPK